MNIDRREPVMRRRYVLCVIALDDDAFHELRRHFPHGKEIFDIDVATRLMLKPAGPKRGNDRLLNLAIFNWYRQKHPRIIRRLSYEMSM